MSELEVSDESGGGRCVAFSGCRVMLDMFEYFESVLVVNIGAVKDGRCRCSRGEFDCLK